MEIFNKYWEKNLILDKKYKLRGWSRAGILTGFILEPFKIFLDAGIQTYIKPNLILITHTHQDHINSFYNLLLNNNVTVVSSLESIDYLQKYLNANQSLNCLSDKIFIEWNPQVIITKKTFIVNNTEFEIIAYDLEHGIKTYAYGINEIRYKLKKEYYNLSQDELKNKNDITEKIFYSILLFCGDMDCSSLKTLPFHKYLNIIIECTFLYEEHINEARQKKHLHILDLIPYIESNINTKFILIHFSPRYNIQEIKCWSNKYSQLTNLIFWI
jgi:ribonuclease BN (tRNA processing enzyme)